MNDAVIVAGFGTPLAKVCETTLVCSGYRVLSPSFPFANNWSPSTVAHRVILVPPRPPGAKEQQEASALVRGLGLDIDLPVRALCPAYPRVELLLAEAARHSPLGTDIRAQAGFGLMFLAHHIRHVLDGVINSKDPEGLTAKWHTNRDKHWDDFCALLAAIDLLWKGEPVLDWAKEMGGESKSLRYNSAFQIRTQIERRFGLGLREGATRSSGGG